MSKRQEFLAGERTDDVAIYLSEQALSSTDDLAQHGESVDGGVVLVLPGEQGRSVFATATGMDAMQFAQRAMNSRGDVDDGLVGGTCPNDDGADDHEIRVVFSFAEERNEEAGGLYAEGDVVHAYAHCSCGTAFSDRWLVD